MENQPQNIIAIGRKRIPIEEIALVEPFEPPTEQPPRFASDKEFKTRVVLIDRYSVLTEETVEAFAEANKFRWLPDDNAATNTGGAVSRRDLRALGGFSATQTVSVPSQMARSGRQRAKQAVADKTGDGNCRGLARRSGTGAGSAGNAERGRCPAAPRPQARRAQRPAKLRTRPRLTESRSLGGGRRRRRRGPPHEGRFCHDPGFVNNSRLIRASAFGAGLSYTEPQERLRHSASIPDALIAPLPRQVA
jgi:hypothetical protein